MSSYETENRALKRLSTLTWRGEGDDDFVTMRGTLPPQALKDLGDDLGEETRAALGFSLIANKTKVMLRKSLAEQVFRIEGLPALNIQEAARAR